MRPLCFSVARPKNDAINNLAATPLISHRARHSVVKIFQAALTSIPLALIW
jgi:hypothetical protein